MARFLMEWRKDNVPHRKEVNQIEQEGQVYTFSPWQYHTTNYSDIIYTHKSSGIYWNSSTLKVEGRSEASHTSYWVEKCDKEDFLSYCDQLEAGKSWKQIHENL